MDSDIAAADDVVAVVVAADNADFGVDVAVDAGVDNNGVVVVDFAAVDPG